MKEEIDVANIASYCFFFPWSMLEQLLLAFLGSYFNYYLKELPVLLNSLFLQASSLKLILILLQTFVYSLLFSHFVFLNSKYITFHLHSQPL